MKKFVVYVEQNVGKYHNYQLFGIVGVFDTYDEADEFWCKKKGRILNENFDGYLTLDIMEVNEEELERWMNSKGK